ncbi:hypothetical protein [Marinimicrococcus flavescens]|uniref:Uncharacterized protein n=1 Tax=Marinimicrococcus flavescens TaxID=3031815 RepID=A0AAP3XRU8_9PROT|nr:hypothetical protein [Marinimicrococcus flavescens]
MTGLTLCALDEGRAQTATPTVVLGVWVTEQNSILWVPGVTVCVTPDRSEPAFWGKWTPGAGGGLPGIPGVVWMDGIPLPPGMANQPVTVTVAKQGYVDSVVTDALSSFLPSAGANPGSFNLRRIRMVRGGQTTGDCGTPPPDPLRPGLQMFLDPQEAALSPGNRITFKLLWSGHNFAAPWYLYSWEPGDPAIARAAAPSQTPEIEIEALSPGTTLLTPFLLRPDGTRKQGDSARIKVDTGGPPPPPTPPQEAYGFGWERPVTQREVNDFSLPHSCADGKNLEQLVHSRSPAVDPNGCSLRTNPDEGCSTCHRPNGTRPDLRTIDRAAFCNQVPNFAANATKPSNLKDFFNDWYNRQPTGCPD